MTTSSSASRLVTSQVVSGVTVSAFITALSYLERGREKLEQDASNAPLTTSCSATTPSSLCSERMVLGCGRNVAITPSQPDSCSVISTRCDTDDGKSKRRLLYRRFMHPFVVSSSWSLPRTLCEEERRAGNENVISDDINLERDVAVSNEEDENSDDEKHAIADSLYPNFSRHGKRSLLRQYLTVEIYRELWNRRTTSGVTLEDIIRAGVSLPWGSDPPRGVAGVYAGDADSYRTFAPLLDPIIERHHRTRPEDGGGGEQHGFGGGGGGIGSSQFYRRLQRHRTDLNPQQLLKQKLDPEGQYILYTRLRLARSLRGFRFTPCIDRAERRNVEALVRDCVRDWKKQMPDAAGGKYVSVMEMSNGLHEDLIRRKILFPDPDDYAIAAGLGRDWPDGRGIYCDNWTDTPALMIWCNFEDHIWIISNAKGGDVQKVFTRLSRAAWALETALSDRGHALQQDPRLGFLNSSPANIGTALRASVYMKLVHLGRKPGFYDLIKRLRLEARAEHSRQETTSRLYTGIFDIANAEALGKSEVELINVMIEGVGRLIELEKRLERGEEIDLNRVAV